MSAEPWVSGTREGPRTLWKRLDRSLWAVTLCPFPQRPRWAGTTRGGTESSAMKPSSRPLALGVCGPSMAAMGQKGALKIHDRKDTLSGRARGGVDSMSAGPSLDLSKLMGQRCGISPASVSPNVNYTWTLISQAPSSSKRLRSQDSKWPHEGWGDRSCPCCIPGAQHGPGM